MPWETIFFVVMAVITLGWVVLLFAPRRDVTIPLLLEILVFGVCLVYLLPITYTLFVIPESFPILNFFDMQGVHTIFNHAAGTTTEWVHMAVLDLFAGLWVASDADSRGVGRGAQIPFLLLTFMFCPIGIVVWLIRRRFLPPANPAAATV